MELITACLLISFCIVIWKTYFSPLARKLNKFPGPFVLPGIGNAYNMGLRSGLTKFLSKQLAYYDGCYRFWMFSKPFLMISNHRVGEILLSSKHTDRLSEPSEMYMGEGLITSSGEVWRQDRKELNNSFSQIFINRFIDTFNYNAQMLLNDLKLDSKSSTCPKDLNPHFLKWTLNVVLESSMGKLSSAVHGLNKDESLKSIQTVIESLHKLMWKPWLRWPVIRDVFGTVKDDAKHVFPLQKKLYKIIDEQRALFERKAGSSNLRTFVDILLDGKKRRSTQNIVDHVFTLLAAGTDTSSLCMNFTLYLLASNPEHQRLVHEELDDIFRNRASDDMYTTVEDIGDMKYLEMCIKESLRLFPPAPLLPRIITNDIPVDERRIIPKGSFAVIVLYDYHRDPKVYPDPEKFHPNRFTPEECAKRSPYDYLPFSGGARTCIGQKYAIMEIKLFLAYILRNFQIKTNMAREDIQVDYSIALIPKQKLMLQLIPRV